DSALGRAAWRENGGVLSPDEQLRLSAFASGVDAASAQPARPHAPWLARGAADRSAALLRHHAFDRVFLYYVAARDQSRLVAHPQAIAAHDVARHRAVHQPDARGGGGDSRAQLG